MSTTNVAIKEEDVEVTPEPMSGVTFSKKPGFYIKNMGKRRGKRTPMEKAIRWHLMSNSQRQAAMETAPLGHGNFHSHLQRKRIHGKWRVKN